MAAGRRGTVSLTRLASRFFFRSSSDAPAHHAAAGARPASARSSCKSSTRSAAQSAKETAAAAPQCRLETGLALAAASLSPLYPQWLRFAFRCAAPPPSPAPQRVPRPLWRPLGRSLEPSLFAPLARPGAAVPPEPCAISSP
jgi:hypothetical protein